MAFAPTPPPLPPTPAYTPPPGLTEYAYHSLYALDQLGIIINVVGAPTDPDGDVVTLSMVPVADPGTGQTAAASPVFTATATRQATGVYAYTTTAANLSRVGYFTVYWSFALSGVTQVVQTWLQVAPPAPAYDALPLVARNVVEQVYANFSDGTDSPMGGPNLLQWPQSHFGRNRVAQLLYQTIQHINAAAQPSNWFSADGSTSGLFPYLQWGGLVLSGLSVQVILHLMRSYVEDPDLVGNVQVRANRRDYLSRWSQMLPYEQQEYKRQLDVFKLSQMAGPRVLVSGGAYGNWNNMRTFNMASFPAYAAFWF
jgi:hypothetical protein